ncbi:MAG: TylF/MycF/NovP-related O-methyltransferase [Cyclobacteriaceae bacterium]
MVPLIKSLGKGLIDKLGYRLIKKQNAPLADIEQNKEFMELFKFCEPFSMTSIERMYSLYSAVHYVIRYEIPGDFVECGVWKGGSSMVIAKTLVSMGITNRKIYLYDTFEGMSQPTQDDVNIHGRQAKIKFEAVKTGIDSSNWCYADLESVRANMALTGISSSQIELMKGKVEDTIPKNRPAGNIALLRLDTDWFESTLHELTHLYPLVVKNGVLIIDDYGHWSGCKKAVDQYFGSLPDPIYLSRIDYTGRVSIKK